MVAARSARSQVRARRNYPWSSPAPAPKKSPINPSPIPSSAGRYRFRPKLPLVRPPSPPPPTPIPCGPGQVEIPNMIRESAKISPPRLVVLNCEEAIPLPIAPVSRMAEIDRYPLSQKVRASRAKSDFEKGANARFPIMSLRSSPARLWADLPERTCVGRVSGDTAPSLLLLQFRGRYLRPDLLPLDGLGRERRVRGRLEHFRLWTSDLSLLARLRCVR